MVPARPFVTFHEHDAVLEIIDEGMFDFINEAYNPESVLKKGLMQDFPHAQVGENFYQGMDS